MIKEALQKLIDENHARAEEYLRLKLEASESGVAVDEQVFIRNHAFLLGRGKGLEDALKLIEKIESEADSKVEEKQ